MEKITAQEIRQVRINAELTQGQASGLMGIKTRIWRYYETINGKKKVHIDNDFWVKFLKKIKILNTLNKVEKSEDYLDALILGTNLFWLKDKKTFFILSEDSEYLFEYKCEFEKDLSTAFYVKKIKV